MTKRTARGNEGVITAAVAECSRSAAESAGSSIESRAESRSRAWTDRFVVSNRLKLTPIGRYLGVFRQYVRKGSLGNRKSRRILSAILGLLEETRKIGKGPNRKTRDEYLLNELGEDSRLDWPYLAGAFDGSGVLYKKRNCHDAGWEARIRFSSYNRDFLEQVQHFLKGGSITGEAHPKGSYYRLTITGYYRIQNILTRLTPFLIRKRLTVERWLLLHKANAEIGRIKRRLRLKPRKYFKTEVRSLQRQISQLLPPPPRDTK